MESLFDGTRDLLSQLRSADERHAIALLDVEIEKLVNGVPLDVLTLVAARNAVLRRLVALSRNLATVDASDAEARALVEAVRRVV